MITSQRVISLMLAFFFCVLGQTSEAADPNQKLLFGMSTALSGPAAYLGQEMQRGVLAGFEHLNVRGGVRGQRLILITPDDGYEPGRAAPNIRRLLEKEEVLAVMGNVGTPTAIASLPLIRDHQTLLFAQFSGAGVLRRDPPDKYVINIRASYTEEITAMVDALINHGGLRPEQIAFFTQRDGYGDAGYVGGFSALKKHGLRDDRNVLHVRYQRNTLTVENALADILLAKPQPRAIIMVGSYAPCAKFLTLARQANLDILFLGVSFVGSGALAKELTGDPPNLLITQVVPPPNDTSLPLVRDYLVDLSRNGETAKPSHVSLEGYLAARILGRALQNFPNEIIRKNVIKALESLGQFDIGIGHPLTLSPSSHQASHEVWPTRLVNGRFEPFNWQDIIHLLPSKER